DFIRFYYKHFNELELSKHSSHLLPLLLAQVFPPLRLFPCGLNLLRGAELQLHTLGGPQPARLTFILVDESGVSLKSINVSTPGQSNPPLLQFFTSGRNRLDKDSIDSKNAFALDLDNTSSNKLVTTTLAGSSSASVLIRAAVGLGASGVARVKAVAIALPVVAAPFKGNASAGLPIYETGPAVSETICTINVVGISAVRIGCPLGGKVPSDESASSTFSEMPDSTGGRLGSAHSESTRYLVASRTGGNHRPLGSLGLNDPPGVSSVQHGPTRSGAPLWVEGLVAPTLPAAQRKSHNSPSSAHKSGSNSDGAESDDIGFGVFGGLVSPIGMAGIKPSLRFIWRLNPPQPSAPARLDYWLHSFGVLTQEVSGFLVFYFLYL
ncbi:unnamed protein product, partial [Protopolystoma xenopodis]